MTAADQPVCNCGGEVNPRYCELHPDVTDNVAKDNNKTGDVMAGGYCDKCECLEGFCICAADQPKPRSWQCSCNYQTMVENETDRLRDRCKGAGRGVGENRNGAS
jgi:hypothetical protein